MDRVTGTSSPRKRVRKEHPDFEYSWHPPVEVFIKDERASGEDAQVAVSPKVEEEKARRASINAEIISNVLLQAEDNSRSHSPVELEEENSNPDANCATEKSIVYQDKKGFTCETCGFVAADKSNLKHHMKKSHGLYWLDEKCEVLLRADESSLTESHFEVDDRNSSPDVKCSTEKSSADKDKKGFTCEECSVATANKYNLLRHMKRSHGFSWPARKRERVEEEDVRPKRTWTQIIDEALMAAEGKRLSNEQLYASISRNYPSLRQDAKRQKVVKDALARYGYKKVKGEEGGEHLWAPRDYEGADVVDDGTARSLFAFCKRCSSPVDPSRLEIHQLTSKCNPHLVYLCGTKIAFCRNCAQMVVSSGLAEHDEQCRLVDAEASAANLAVFTARRIQNFWTHFRDRNKFDFDSCDVSELAAEISHSLEKIADKWRGPSREREDVSEDIKKKLWPKFLLEWRKNNRGEADDKVDILRLDMEDSPLRGEFEQWVEEKRRKKSESVLPSYYKICGRCGKTLSQQNIKRHEARCANRMTINKLGRRLPVALCNEDHEHQGGN